MADRDRYMVFDRVYQVGGPKLSSQNDCCVYLVDGNGTLVLIDSGYGPGFELIIANIETLGFEMRSIAAVLLTHCHIDHAGGAARFQREYGISIIANELDTPPLETGNSFLTAAFLYGVELDPIRINKVLSGNSETIPVGDLELNIIHTPGHTPGSICAFCDINGARILFGQDIHGPFHPDFKSNIEDWRSSMDKLLELDADILCEGHFGIYKPANVVRDYIESYLDQY